jgi:hypothetical protein
MRWDYDDAITHYLLFMCGHVITLFPVTLDTIVAFVIPLIALMTSSPMTTL